MNEKRFVNLSTGLSLEKSIWQNTMNRWIRPTLTD